MFYKFIKLVLTPIFRMLYKINIVNEDRIVNDRKLIICSNHIHIFDPVVLIIIFSNQIHWMGKKELFENKLLGFIFSKLGAFPVDRDNVGLSTMRKSMNILKGKSTLGIFPEGTRVKELDLKNAKPGVAFLSIQTKTPILPVYIESSYKPFSEVNIYIGEEIDFSDSYGEKLTSKDYKDYGEQVLLNIYNIKDS